MTLMETVRRRLGLTQVQMGERLGMTTRAVGSIEAGQSKERPIHRLAIERISLARAIEAGDPMLATPTMREAALRLAYLINPERDQ